MLVNLLYMLETKVFKRLGIFENISNIDVGISNTWCEIGGTFGYMSINGNVVCMYCVQDAVWEELREVVCALKLMGIEIVMLLTSDNQKNLLMLPGKLV